MVIEILSPREMAYFCKLYSLQHSFGLETNVVFNSTRDGKKPTTEFPVKFMVINNVVQFIMKSKRLSESNNGNFYKNLGEIND